MALSRRLAARAGGDLRAISPQALAAAAIGILTAGGRAVAGTGFIVIVGVTA